MERSIPQALLNFLKNALDDVDDGFEYASELNRILNSDACQSVLTGKEIEKLRDYADTVKKLGEINNYTKDRFRETEREFFGSGGINAFLGISKEPPKPVWPF